MSTDVSAKKLQKFFPDVPLSDSVRPREIHLLVSHPPPCPGQQKIRMVGDVALGSGLEGSTAPSFGVPRSLEFQSGRRFFSAGVITTTEQQGALTDLFLAAQDAVTFPTTTTDRLVANREKETADLWWKSPGLH